MGESLAKAFADVYKLILTNTELFSLKTLSKTTPKQKTDIHINSEIKQKCCRRISCGSIFVFESDFHPCYKIAFEKQGVRLSTVWWRRVDSNHRSKKQQIYSLSPLATRELLHIQSCVNANSYYKNGKPVCCKTNTLLA